VNRFLKDVVFYIEQWMTTKSDLALKMFDISSNTWETLGLANVKIGKSGTKKS